MTGLEFLHQARLADLDSCIVWPYCKTSKGYGRVSALGIKGRKAHRLAYELAHGELQLGQVVMHTCDNPSCVNPKHLRAGTVADNQADMKTKGRARNQSRPASDREAAEILSLREAGHSQVRIAEITGRSQAFVSTVLIRHGQRSFTRKLS